MRGAVQRHRRSTRLHPAVDKATAATAAEPLDNHARSYTSLTELLNALKCRRWIACYRSRYGDRYGRPRACAEQLKAEALTGATARSMVEKAERTGAVPATGDNYRRSRQPAGLSRTRRRPDR